MQAVPGRFEPWDLLAIRRHLFGERKSSQVRLPLKYEIAGASALGSNAVFQTAADRT